MINIRKETHADFNAVYELNKLAFQQTNEAELVDALRKNKEAFIPELSLVAEKENEIIGHILLTRIQIIDENKNAVESLALAPMAVLPTHQNFGIGSQLITTAIELATSLGFSSIIVLGHEKYYPKFGFKPASLWEIKAPFAVPNEAFLALELQENSLNQVKGTVQYAKEFSLV